MEEILKIVKSDELAIFGSISSILSLALTFAIFLGIRKIKRFYIFTARVPDLNERLIKIASNISSALTSGSFDTTTLTEILADAEVTLKSLTRKVKNPLRSDANKIIKEIRNLERCNGFFCKLLGFWGSKNAPDDEDSYENQIRKIYLDLYRLNAECREVYEDARWEQ